MEKKTATPRLTEDEKVAARQWARFHKKGGHPNIEFKKSNDPKIYYFKFKDIEQAEGIRNGEFITGEYLGEIRMGANRLVPPRVTMRTPTGVYPIDTENFCVSVGQYHPNDYSPTIGIDGFVRIILSGLIYWRELGNGIGLIATTDSEANEQRIRQFAISSVEYNNTNNRHILAHFE